MNDAAVIAARQLLESLGFTVSRPKTKKWGSVRSVIEAHLNGFHRETPNLACRVCRFVLMKNEHPTHWREPRRDCFACIDERTSYMFPSVLITDAGKSDSNPQFAGWLGAR